MSGSYVFLLMTKYFLQMSFKYNKLGKFFITNYSSSLFVELIFKRLSFGRLCNAGIMA